MVLGLLAWGGWALFSTGSSTSVQSPIVTAQNATDQTDQTASSTGQGDNALATSSQSAGNVGNGTTNPNQTHMITITTNYGAITFETYDADAPNTVQNFVTLADKGFYNGLTFHRVISGFMIQGGDPKGDGTGGPGYSFADEINPSSPLYQTGYKKGIVAMANSGPNTNGSQFFIMAADYPLPPSYTIFGHVVSGQDVVDTIDAVKTGAGDKPVIPVVMKTVVVK